MATTDDALDAILSGHNVEILGGAGRGKSTLIHYLVCTTVDYLNYHLRGIDIL